MNAIEEARMELESEYKRSKARPKHYTTELPETVEFDHADCKAWIFLQDVKQWPASQKDERFGEIKEAVTRLSKKEIYRW